MSFTAVDGTAGEAMDLDEAPTRSEPETVGALASISNGTHTAKVTKVADTDTSGLLNASRGAAIAGDAARSGPGGLAQSAMGVLGGGCGGVESRGDDAVSAVNGGGRGGAKAVWWPPMLADVEAEPIAVLASGDAVAFVVAVEVVQMAIEPAIDAVRGRPRPGGTRGVGILLCAASGEESPNRLVRHPGGLEVTLGAPNRGRP